MKRSADDIINASLAGFSKHLKQVRADLGRVAGTSAVGTPEPTSRSSLGGAAVAVAGAAAGAVVGMIPSGGGSAVDMQQALFQANFATGVPRGREDFNRLSLSVQGILGDNQTSVGAAQRSAAILSNLGFDPYGVSGRAMLSNVGAISLTTGMANEEVSGILGSQSTNPQMTNRLRMVGFEMFDSSGNPKDPGSIADHLVKTVYGASPSPQQIQRGLRPGGALDLMLKSYVPDPGMQSVLKDAMFKRAFAGTSAAGTSVVQGVDATVNPRKSGLRYFSSESRRTNAFRDSIVAGYTTGLDVGSNMNDSLSALVEGSSVLSSALNGLAAVLGALGGFTSTTPGQVTVAALSATGMAGGGAVDASEMFDALGVRKFATGGEIASYAQQFTGVKYVPSDTLPGGQESASPQNGWDCATFTWYVLKHFGINAPNYTGDYEVDKKPKHIKLGEELPGDLVLFRKNYHHIGINIGGGRMVHAANPNAGTIISTWKNDYYMSHFTSILRYWDGAATPGAATPDGTGNVSGGTKEAGVPASNNSGNTGSGILGVAMPSFIGVSISVGLSGVKAAASSILEAMNGTAPWASLGNFTKSTSTASPDSSSPGTPAGAYDPTTPSKPVTSGKGASWLKRFIAAHNVREPAAHILWSLGMRESSGDPSLVDGQDYGLWQINDSHLEDIRKIFGNTATMRDMLDPEKNFKYMTHISNNLTKWTPWGLAADGKHFDWSDYSAGWQSRNAAASEREYTNWYGKYSQYSKGAWRIEDDQIAKIHQNEMVLPSELAEEVRHEYGHHSESTVVNVVIGEASRQQAIRFAQRMKDVLEQEKVVSGV